MMARVLHNELGNLKFIERTGVVLNQKSDLYSILIDADMNTTIFIDEAQALKTLEVLQEYEKLSGEIPGRADSSGPA